MEKVRVRHKETYNRGLKKGIKKVMEFIKQGYTPDEAEKMALG